MSAQSESAVTCCSRVQSFVVLFSSRLPKFLFSETCSEVVSLRRCHDCPCFSLLFCLTNKPLPQALSPTNVTRVPQFVKKKRVARFRLYDMKVYLIDECLFIFGKILDYELNISIV